MTSEVKKMKSKVGYTIGCLKIALRLIFYLIGCSNLKYLYRFLTDSQCIVTSLIFFFITICKLYKHVIQCLNNSASYLQNIKKDINFHPKNIIILLNDKKITLITLKKKSTSIHKEKK